MLVQGVRASSQTCTPVIGTSREKRLRRNAEPAAPGIRTKRDDLRKMIAWDGLQTWWRTYYCKKLEEVLEGPAATSVLTSGHVLLTCGVAAALLISQLMLQQWPANFFGFCMLSPLLTALLIGGVAVAAFPSCLGSVGVLLAVATVALTAWQSVLGGVFHQLPIGDSRPLFTLINTLVIASGVFLASRGSLPRHLRKAVLQAVTKAGRPRPVEPVERELVERQAEVSDVDVDADVDSVQEGSAMLVTE